MNTPNVQLEPGEKILLSESKVRHGCVGDFDQDLLLTNKSIILVERGLFGRIKSLTRFPGRYISDPRFHVTGDGEKQLVFRTDHGDETFTFSLCNHRTIRVWCMAIEDRANPERHMYDADYYRQFSDENVWKAMKDREVQRRSGKPVDRKKTEKKNARIARSLSHPRPGHSSRASRLAKTRAKNGEAWRWYGMSELEASWDNSISIMKGDLLGVVNDVREGFGKAPITIGKDNFEKKLNDAFEQYVAEVRGKEQPTEASSAETKTKVFHIHRS